MKTKAYLPLLALVLLTFFNCDEIDKLTEINTTQKFETTLDIDVATKKEGKTQSKSGNDSFAWSESVTIDLKDNEKVNDNLDLIEEVTVTGLTYEIINYTEGSDTAAISDAQIDFDGTIITLEDVTLKTADDANTLYTIDDTDKLALIANKLKTDLEMTITASGQINETPVKFGIKLHLDTAIVIDVL